MAVPQALHSKNSRAKLRKTFDGERKGTRTIKAWHRATNSAGKHRLLSRHRIRVWCTLQLGHWEGKTKKRKVFVGRTEKVKASDLT